MLGFARRFLLRRCVAVALAASTGVVVVTPIVAQGWLA
jgi:hypothetical protein